MEQVRDKHKIEHQRYTIQYNDKAISNLKWNKQISKRQRIKVRFKNKTVEQVYDEIMNGTIDIIEKDPLADLNYIKKLQKFIWVLILRP